MEATGEATKFPEIKVPAGLTFAGLVLGFAIGVALHGTPLLERILEVAAPAGKLWLRALQLTIIPLVVGLVYTGISQTLAAAGVCVFAGLCYAEMAAAVPVAGSAYTYAYATMGQFIAWVIGWDLVLEYGVAASRTNVDSGSEVNSNWDPSSVVACETATGLSCPASETSDGLASAGSCGTMPSTARRAPGS